MTKTATLLFFFLLYMGLLLLVILLPEQRLLIADELLLACGHCLKVLVLILLCWEHPVSTSERGLAAALFVSIAVVVPLMLQNYFARFLTADALAGGTLVRAAAIGLFVVALVLVLFLCSRRESVGRSVAHDQEQWLLDRCRQATEGADLSPKELEVVVFAYRGFTVQRAAEGMGVAPSTADTHLRHAYRKLGVHARQELIDLVDAGAESAKIEQ